ncbi:MAG: 4Fe-4S dicluster domain-containing protein, partial [bacterium]|nr:4Fe-4S dicluster domain-containing protein [bacterium]
LSTLRYFKDEYEEHIRDKKCRGGVCKPLIKYCINKGCTGCRVCALQCPVNAISGEKKQLHLIDPGTCIKCGICYEVCKFNAVEVK